MTPDKVKQCADRLVTTLEGWYRTQNRAPLAQLRRGLSETTRYEASLVLGRMFGPLAVGNTVFEAVAGCFALHPFEGPQQIGNFGETMRRTMPSEKMREEKEPHARFRRLLACSSTDEICAHIRHAVRLAKSREPAVPVNYRRLFLDLWWWNDRTKIEWAKSYWEVTEGDVDVGLLGAGLPIGEEEQEIVPE